MMPPDKFAEFCRPICRGDEDAVEFLVEITAAAHLLDDLIDKDPGPSEEAIQRCFWSLLITLPRNPFYRRHFADLNPLVANALLDWRVANRLEREGTTEDHPISFIIRSSYVCLLQQTALIVGGPEWAEEAGMLIRKVAHGETLDAYRKTMEKPNVL